MRGKRKEDSKWWRICSRLRRHRDVMAGEAVFARLMERPADTHYLLLPQGIGDTLCALGYLREYKRQKGYRHVTAVLWADSTRQMCDFYPDLIDGYVSVSRKENRQLKAFVTSSVLGSRLCAGEYRERFTAAAYNMYFARRIVDDNPYIRLTDYVKDLLYQIGPDAPLEPPHVPPLDVTDFARRYGLIKGRTVFLQPNARTVELQAPELFARLAAALRREGYAVVTVTEGPDARPVPGTAALSCSLGEAYRLAEYGGTMIAIRSGFLDLMVFAQCRVISIEDICYKSKWSFDLRMWGVGDCHCVTYQDDETTLRQIMQIMGRQDRSAARGESFSC